MLEIKNTKFKGTWREVADSARTTIGLDVGEKEPSNKWKKQILLAEHSPIRQILFKWKWENIPYWVSVHFVRHWLGIIHFVKSQRDDRTQMLNQTHESRSKSPQDTPVIHECEANVQALINISRKRLCSQASKETREAWKLVVEDIKKKDPILGSVLVPECIYRGFCPEFKSCGYTETEEFKTKLEKYRICK
jgi:hypothetical protein